MTYTDPMPPQGFSGIWVCESPDGSRSEITYVDGVAHGSFHKFLADGTVVREGEMSNGQYHGRHLVRDSDGTLLDETVVEDGCGVYKIFTTDGRLGWKIPLRNGKRHGVVGRLVQGQWIEEEYTDGARTSTFDPTE